MEEQKKTETQYKLVPIELINEPERPMRSEMEAEKLEELTESVRALGIIEPLILRDGKNGLEIVAGHRRYLASKRAGLSHLPCIVRSLSNADGELIKFAENFAREDGDPLAQAVAFEQIINENS